MTVERKNLTQLFVPICFETLFYMLSGMVDTLMLSSVSDQAVGAVGTANTYIGVFIIMFGVISSGMIAVMTQNIGAGKPGIAYQARQLGLIFNAVVGILMSAFLAIFSGTILKVVSIAPALLEPAETYLRIVGGACFLNALIPIFASYLRIYKAIVVRIDCRKCDQFYLERSISVCPKLGRYGRGNSDGDLTCGKSDHGCNDGSRVDQGEEQSGESVVTQNFGTDHQNRISVRL